MRQSCVRSLKQLQKTSGAGTWRTGDRKLDKSEGRLFHLLRFTGWLCKADCGNGKGSRPCADRSRCDLSVWKGSEGLATSVSLRLSRRWKSSKMAAELFVICVKLAICREAAWRRITDRGDKSERDGIYRSLSFLLAQISDIRYN